MSKKLNGIYIEASQDAYDLLTKLGVKPTETYEHFVDTMGVKTFMIHKGKMVGTDGDVNKIKWFKKPKEMTENKLKKLILDDFLSNYDLTSMPTYKEYSKMFLDLKKHLDVPKDKGIDIGFAFGLKDKIAEIVSQDAKYLYSDNGEKKIKEMLKTKYKKMFKKDDLREMSHDKIVSHPIYPALIVELNELARNGKHESLSYLLKNIHLGDFDIDMLVLGNAVKSSQNYVVETILDYVSNSKGRYDGSDGHFTSRIQSVINEDLSNLNLTLQDKFLEVFDWAEKPKFDEAKAYASEEKRREQDKIEQYKKMFPGLDL